METKKLPIEIACEIVGSQAALARILGVTPAMVNQLVNGSRPVPVEHCKAIARATAEKVTCQELRPEDWQKIWPELIEPSADTTPNRRDPDQPRERRNPDVPDRRVSARSMAERQALADAGKAA